MKEYLNEQIERVKEGRVKSQIEEELGEEIEKNFKEIDKEEENKNVIKFQKNKSLEILEELYLNRVPTLKKWAWDYHYLDDSVDDLFSELTQVFIRTVHKYKRHKRTKKYYGKKITTVTPFNTYLWFALDHYIKNLMSRKRAKKRRPIGSDPNSISNVTLSLDFSYDTKGESNNTLKDIIANDLGFDTKDDENITKQIYLDETIDVLASEYPNIKEFLKRLSAGNTIAALLREYKTKQGRIKISKIQANKLNKRKCTRIVSGLIKSKTRINDDFCLVNYYIKKGTKLCYLHYQIEMKKTEETDFIVKVIRKIRKNRDHLLNIIEG